MPEANSNSGIVDFVASRAWGQYLIKKIDTVLWAIEKPAKYCVDSGKKDEGRQLAWPVFWIILINLQIIRVIASSISARLYNDPIEAKDVVTSIQRWRRSLRVIRFRGLQKIREREFGKGNPNDSGAERYVPEKHSSKKRNHDEMLDYNVLEELMNRTYSDTDDLDTTFMINKSMEASSSGSTSEEYYDSPTESQNDNNVLKDTLPITSASESEHPQPKSNELTCGDTEESAFVTEDDSISSLNVENRTDTESNDQQSSKSDTMPSKKKVGKESLNVYSDPADEMISKLAQVDQKGKSNGKNKQGRKKRYHSLTASRENLDVENPGKKSNSQQDINLL